MAIVDLFDLLLHDSDLPHRLHILYGNTIHRDVNSKGIIFLQDVTKQLSF